MINIVRGTGATNILFVPGDYYGSSLSCGQNQYPGQLRGARQRLAARRRTSTGATATNPQLGVVVDDYPDNCSSTSCMNYEYKRVAQQMPLVVGETGSLGGSLTPVNTILSWFDANANGYFYWSWFCGYLIQGSPPTCYTSKTPTSTDGINYYNHINGIAPPPPA